MILKRFWRSSAHHLLTSSSVPVSYKYLSVNQMLACGFNSAKGGLIPLLISHEYDNAVRFRFIHSNFSSAMAFLRRLSESFRRLYRWWRFQSSLRAEDIIEYIFISGMGGGGNLIAVKHIMFLVMRSIKIDMIQCAYMTPNLPTCGFSRSLLQFEYYPKKSQKYSAWVSKVHTFLFFFKCLMINSKKR